MEKDSSTTENQYDEFFIALADRFTKENSVSDMLYALLKTSREFQLIFKEILYMHFPEELRDTFFFPEIDLIEREVVYPEGRPDFRINFITGQKIIIEVKIYDCDYHYENYKKIKQENSNKIEFIVLLTHDTLVASKYPDWIKITWKEIRDSITDNASPLLKSFALYLTEAINLKEIKMISFNRESMQSILYFNRMLLDSIHALNREDINSQKYNSTFLEDGNGIFMKIDFGNISIYPWVGINYNGIHDVGIMVWFQRHSHANIFNQLIEILSPKYEPIHKGLNPKGKMSISENRNDLVIMMKEEDFNCFLTNDLENNIVKEKQEEILHRFLLDIFKLLKEGFAV